MKKHLHVELPSGAIATVDPKVSKRTLKALDALAIAAQKQCNLGPISSKTAKAHLVWSTKPKSSYPLGAKMRVKNYYIGSGRYNSRTVTGTGTIYAIERMPSGTIGYMVRFSGKSVRDKDNIPYPDQRDVFIYHGHIGIQELYRKSYPSTACTLLIR
jgi:hypothetical protein